LQGAFFVDRVAEGFGKTVGQIGLLIAMASIIGEGMLRSGAADRIVQGDVANRLGRSVRRVPFLASGFLLGIPVFFDTVFYLVIPLIKAVRLRSGRHYLWYILALIAGGSMTHSLVPPTPGPLFVATELQDRDGDDDWDGVSGWYLLFRRWLPVCEVDDGKIDLPLRETTESLARMEELAEPVGEMSCRSAWLALVADAAAGGLDYDCRGWPLPGLRILRSVGDKNLALMIGAVMAMLIAVSLGDARGV
jgi:GntP family gluconate:H+ symporter